MAKVLYKNAAVASRASRVSNVGNYKSSLMGNAAEVERKVETNIFDVETVFPFFWKVNVLKGLVAVVASVNGRFLLVEKVE